MLLSEELLSLPLRERTAHKAEFGHVLVVGGDYGMGGAVRLAGEAALRTGAGLVSLATRPEHAFAILGSCPELMCHGIQEVQEVTRLFALASVIVAGPGLGRQSWGEVLFLQVFHSDLPLLVDGDALGHLAVSKLKREDWILTPHPGEAARLLGTTVVDVQRDRKTAIQALQAQYGGVIVLKGAGSLVLGEELSICQAGNPGMATAGMGDVLSGVIAGLVAQGLSLEKAAKLGVCLHAEAGDQVAQQGQRGLKASDLFGPIRQCLNA